MMKDGLPIIGLLAFLGLGLLVPSGAPGIVPLQSGSEAAYIAEIREHRRKREERLRAPFSPLALVHREYLNERAQITLGTGPNVDVKLNDPAVAPLHAQLDARFSPPILRAQGTARFARFEMRAEPLAELRLDDGQAFRLGRYELRYIVHVSWGPTLEVYDPGLPALRNFQGLPFFPIDPAYRLDAEVVPFAQAEPIELLDSHGNQRPYWLYGELRFQLHGVACQLELYTDTTDPAEIEKQEFMLIFADATSGQETYPAARYLYVEGRARGSVPVDFNKAFNPPCVFSAVYTCPFPRPRNRLAIPVRAGELWYKTPPNAAR